MGFAGPAIMREIRPGAVFKAEDDAIAFPTERLPTAGPRATHAVRWVIVVDRLDEARASRPKTVAVVPCTASYVGAVAPHDFEVPSPSQQGFTAERVVALVHLVQPILKVDLREYVGQLHPEDFVALQAKLAMKFGLILGVAPVASAGGAPGDVAHDASSEAPLEGD